MVLTPDSFRNVFVPSRIGLFAQLASDVFAAPGKRRHRAKHSSGGTLNATKAGLLATGQFFSDSWKANLRPVKVVSLDH